MTSTTVGYAVDLEVRALIIRYVFYATAYKGFTAALEILSNICPLT
jgi:hypothetical protein